MITKHFFLFDAITASLIKKMYDNKIVFYITIYFLCSADFLLDLKEKEDVNIKHDLILWIY